MDRSIQKFRVNFPRKYAGAFLHAVNSGKALPVRSSAFGEAFKTVFEWAGCRWEINELAEYIESIYIIDGEINDEQILLEYIKNGK